MDDDVAIIPVVEASPHSAIATQCEIALFGTGESCDVSDDTQRYIVGGTNVWLCNDHADIINVTPVAIEA